MHRAGRILVHSSASPLFSRHCPGHILSPQQRWISSTTPLEASWMDKIKGVFTGQKGSPDAASTYISSESFTLLRFADELGKARKLRSFKQYIVGRSSEATFSDAFEKQEAILRHLAGFDSTGENLLVTQKQEAAKHCNCTIADVENVLAKFTWAKEAQRKLEKLKEEGKPMPKSMAEVQKLMGSTPMDLARSNLAKSGQIGRNSPCPCGSKKLYKRCCGKDSKGVGATKL
ncbi:OLC1v1000686C1 [Oldenlandia corymbosa var. corymbosa]|uniref:OLC1v1000686C1 n=1 Tax=Oldenlandia corymbosa var. corymbosa TaxID=529605 RepID=A0AAV1D4H7_OLDCO|nr:OLC1v1000686C1 [Oldenlandia corymbosa var. corymbosa]